MIHRPKRIILTVTALAALSIFIFRSSWTGAPTKPPPTPLTRTIEVPTASSTARLTIDQGEVLVNASDGWTVGIQAQELYTGAQVKTGINARASLTFENIGVLRLEQNTQITVSELTPITVRVYQTIGDTYSKVKKLFDPGSAYEVETPTAVASVRGTAFGVIVDALKESRVIVTDDTVAVSPVLEIDGVRTRLWQATVEKGQATIINQEVIARAQQSQLPPSVSPQEIVLPKEKLPWIEKNRSRDTEFDRKEKNKQLQNLQEKISTVSSQETQENVPCDGQLCNDTRREAGEINRQEKSPEKLLKKILEKRDEQPNIFSIVSPAPSPTQNPIQQIIQPIRDAIERLISPPPKPSQPEHPSLVPLPTSRDEGSKKTLDDQKEKEKEKEKEKTNPTSLPGVLKEPPRVPSLSIPVSPLPTPSPADTPRLKSFVLLEAGVRRSIDGIARLHQSRPV